MAQDYPEEKKKRRQRQQVLVQEQTLSDERIQKLALFLEELAKEGTYLDIQICLRCKSPKVRRVRSLSGDVLGHMALTPPKFRCADCGWSDRITLYATNKPLGAKAMAIVAEAYNLDNKQESEIATKGEEQGLSLA